MFKTLDLFSGCGGLTYGLEMTTQFKCVGAIDHWKPAADTFSHNHKTAALCSSVSEQSVDAILNKNGNIDVVVGGPPCQGFSTSGKRALDDPRNGLVKSYFNAVAQIQPRAFLMENVVGFTSFQRGKLFSEVLEIAHALGYSTFAGIVLASLYGVPQRRKRFILVGLKAGVFEFDASKNNSNKLLCTDQRVGDGVELWSFEAATSDLPLSTSQAYLTSPQNAFQEWVRHAPQGELKDHIAPQHNASLVRLMQYIPQGKSAMDAELRTQIPQDLLPKSAFPNSYARLVASEPSPTITRNFTVPSSARCIHPFADRALTLREGARLQSFPDHYEFVGSYGDKRLMIGNAVPPLLAYALGNNLAKALSV